MKTALKKWTAPLLALAFVATPAKAQEVMHQVSSAKVSFEMQQTPEYSVGGPRAKKTTPLEWLEIEVELEVKTLAKSGYMDQLDAEFYVGVKDANNASKPVLMTGKFSFVDVRAAEGKAWLSAYVSPATLAKATGKNKPSKGDIVAVAVSVSGAGLQKPLAESNGVSLKREGTQWWEEPRFNRQDGSILAKSKTPFAPLWTDRYPLNKDQN
ncbi:MAG: Amuc_1102 family pilus-like protein [Verrucomicrobiales bacterium]